MSIEAMKLALEALESKYIVNCGAWRVQQDQAAKALRAAIETTKALPKGYRPIEEIIAEHEQDPVKKAALDRARARRAEKQEPVAWFVYIPSQQCGEYFDSEDDCELVDWMTNYPDAELTKLYTAPPQREWQRLVKGVRVDGDNVIVFAGNNDAARKLCGALLEEKNT